MLGGRRKSRRSFRDWPKGAHRGASGRPQANIAAVGPGGRKVIVAQPNAPMPPFNSEPLQAMPNTPSSVAIATALLYDDELLAALALPTGKLPILRGVGSGLTRRVDDPAGTFWAVGDRGPNIKIKVAVARFGLEHLAKYADSDGAKVMPCPDIGPAISELRLDGDEVVLVRSLALRDAGGRAISGLPTPGGANALTEPAVTLDGSLIPNDPSGAGHSVKTGCRSLDAAC